MSHAPSMNRRERLAAKRELEKRTKARPLYLVEIPPEEWPTGPHIQRPLRAWQSRSFMVQEHAEPDFAGRTVTRLSVNRVSLRSDGHWDEGITWEDLMRVKREAGYADSYAIEIYPRERDVQNVSNMRHLWVLSAPLPIGWFEP